MNVFEGKTALHWASVQNDCASIVALISYGSNKDAVDQHDQTPLMLAVREGHIDATLALLEHGASKDMVDDIDRSPLQLAVERGHEQLALVLAKWQQVYRIDMIYLLVMFLGLLFSQGRGLYYIMV